MKSPADSNGWYVVEGQEIPLSSAALMELMTGVLDRGAPFRFRARGFSMSPFIKDGDVITVERLSASAPRTGHVVAFRHPISHRLVVHRVVSRNADTCIIKGDAGAEADGAVPIGNLLGRVTRVERLGRAVRLGMGWEGALIAFLTRTNVFQRIVIPIWLLVRPIVRPNVRRARAKE